MNKKRIFVIGLVLFVLGTGYWLISPLWRDKTLNEELPSSATIQDNLESMSAEDKAKLDEEVEAMKDKATSMNDSMPEDKLKIISSADFQPRAHEVEGQAKLIQVGDQKVIRFENFKTTNGPDLKIYLSTSLGDEDYVDLGAIKATEGNINYYLPPGTDTEKYNNVLVWCRAFSVLFSYAEL